MEIVYLKEIMYYIYCKAVRYTHNYSRHGLLLQIVGIALQKQLCHVEQKVDAILANALICTAQYIYTRTYIPCIPLTQTKDLLSQAFNHTRLIR